MNNVAHPEIYVVELDGFLNAVRCFAGESTRSFGARYLQKEGETLEVLVEKLITNDISKEKLISKSLVDFKRIQGIFDDHIYSKLGGADSVCIKNIDWNLVEYYGLISTAEDEKGAWNRLISQESTLLEYSDKQDNKAALFIVEYNDFFVLTYFGNPAY